jgi:hypothetical protein
MPTTGRAIGLVFAIAMFIFSVWMYTKTGDWVAIIFALGSAGYTVLFFTSGPRKESS